MEKLKSPDFLVARWLAIAGAAGAAIAQGFAYFTANAYWNTAAFVAVLIVVAAIAGLWRAASTRNNALVEATIESEQQQK